MKLEDEGKVIDSTAQNSDKADSETANPERAISDSTAGQWEMVIGLEVHTELLTKTKLFCGCKNVFGEEPNTNVCPVCLALPGSLPVLNEAAVELATRIGYALNATVQKSVFHRKNYFYPDMPKAFQISQYDEPICANGWLELPDGFRVGIERAHLEEDTGKTTHLGGTGRIHGSDRSLVDYNRAGVPLVEIVTAPDMRNADQARAYVSELRSILVAIGSSDGRMEEGSLRVDANVSVRQVGSQTLGTRCEIKNLNSLRSLGRAIDYEARRQIELLEAGESVTQQTRHWNEDEGATSAMRSKEEANDYRYFPEPDLVPVEPDAELQSRIRASLPILPAARRARLRDLLDKAGESALALTGQLTTVVEHGLDDLVVEAVNNGAPVRLAVARCANEAASAPAAARKLSAESFAELLCMEAAGRLGAGQAKAVLGVMLERVDAGGRRRSSEDAGTDSLDPKQIADELGLVALDSSEVDSFVVEVANTHTSEWERYLSGDAKVAGFLMGQVMKLSRGKADGKVARAALEAHASREASTS